MMFADLKKKQKCIICVISNVELLTNKNVIEKETEGTGVQLILY